MWLQVVVVVPLDPVGLETHVKHSDGSGLYETVGVWVVDDFIKNCSQFSHADSTERSELSLLSI